MSMQRADERTPNDDDAVRATGFLVRNYKLLSREQWLEDTINHTSRAFLGLTVHCAKCHDHKFDPVTQVEYYQMRAIFEPHQVRTDPVPGVADKKTDGLARVYDKNLTTATLLYLRGDERTPDTARGPLAPGVPAMLHGGGTLTTRPVDLPFRAAHPDRRSFVRQTLRDDDKKSLEAARPRYRPIIDDGKATPRQKSEAESQLAAARARHEALDTLLRTEEIEDAGRMNTPEWKTAATEA